MATAQQSSSYYFRNREKVLKRCKKYYAANKKSIVRNRLNRRSKIPKAELRIADRRRYVKYNYRLSASEHDKLLKLQNYRCPISGRKVDLFSSIDHDHYCCPGAITCGKCIRGILDKSVNSALGFFKKPQWLLSAYLYERWGQK